MVKGSSSAKLSLQTNKQKLPPSVTPSAKKTNISSEPNQKVTNQPSLTTTTSTRPLSPQNTIPERQRKVQPKVIANAVLNDPNRALHATNGQNVSDLKQKAVKENQGSALRGEIDKLKPRKVASNPTESLAPAVEIQKICISQESLKTKPTSPSKKSGEDSKRTLASKIVRQGASPSLRRSQPKASNTPAKSNPSLLESKRPTTPVIEQGLQSNAAKTPISAWRNVLCAATPTDNRFDSPSMLQRRVASPEDRVFWMTSPPSKSLGKAISAVDIKNTNSEADDVGDIVEMLGCKHGQRVGPSALNNVHDENIEQTTKDIADKSEGKTSTDVERTIRNLFTPHSTNVDSPKEHKSSIFKRSHSHDELAAAKLTFSPQKPNKRSRKQIGQPCGDDIDTSNQDSKQDLQKSRRGLFELIGKVQTAFTIGRNEKRMDFHRSASSSLLESKDLRLNQVDEIPGESENASNGSTTTQQIPKLVQSKSVTHQRTPGSPKPLQGQNFSPTLSSSKQLPEFHRHWHRSIPPKIPVYNPPPANIPQSDMKASNVEPSIQDDIPIHKDAPKANAITPSEDNNPFLPSTDERLVQNQAQVSIPTEPADSDDFDFDEGDELEAVLSMYDATPMDSSVATSAMPKAAMENTSAIDVSYDIEQDDWPENLEDVLSMYDAPDKSNTMDEAYKTIPQDFDQFPDDGLDSVLSTYDAALAAALPSCDGSTHMPKKYHRYVVSEVFLQWLDETGNEQEKVLRMLDEKTHGESFACLREQWYFTDVKAGDHVHIIGELDVSTNAYYVTDSNGFLILHPDCLISSTLLSDAHTCVRRSVLDDRVRKSDGMSASMVYGTMLHELIQSALRNNDFSQSNLEAETKLMLMRQLESLYCIGETEEVAETHMKEQLPQVMQWADKFVRDTPRNDAFVAEHRTLPENLNTPLCVGAVLDIEETVWSPMYGLKGNIDVTVETRQRELGSQRLRKAAAPLEIKTGKSTTHMAHRAQTTLYTLMMSDRYDVDVDAGFLYYTKSSEFIRVPAIRNEIAGLINIRNTMATFVKSRTNLPEMKRVMNACQRCFTLDTCLVYHKATENGTAETSNLGVLFDTKTGHITERHASFLRQWDGYLLLEEKDMFKLRKELWCLSGPEREKRGRCLSGLCINETATADFVEDSVTVSDNEEIFGKFKYQFQRAAMGSQLEVCTPSKSSGFLGSRMGVGDPVVISTDADHYALATGFITAMSPDSLTVTVNRPLLGAPEPMPGFNPTTSQTFRPIIEIEPVTSGRRHAGESTLSSKRKCQTLTYRIDKDEMSSGMGLARGNLIGLFTETGDARRRRLVVDLEAPRFNRTNDFVGSPALNDDQNEAIGKILTADDYALILGMPGTGKTTTISQLVTALVARGKSVLLTSYTHTAVDNILLKLKNEGVSFLRLGNVDKVHPLIREHTPNHDGSITTVNQLERLYVERPVVATTCLGIGHPIFFKRRFDYCIVDEASQITLPACLGPLRFADVFVLVGDHNQLPPLVRNPDASGLSISLFRLLSDSHPNAVLRLEHQYRMSKEIMLLSNTLVYENRLKCGTAEIADQELRLGYMDGISVLHEIRNFGDVHGDSSEGCDRVNGCWIEKLLDPRCRVAFLNTDEVPARESRPMESIVNETEATLVHHITEALIACGLNESSLGIISPYRAQLKVISHLLRHRPGVEIHTVDKYQGRDKDCVLVSLVRSNDQQQVGELLSDWRRINVAFTRAKRKLVIIGSQKTLRASKLFCQFLELVHERGWIHVLPKDAHRLHTPPSVSRLHT